ncbi:MAG: hypothetical protein KJ062_20675, partial [Thermoanaerobaculia bacterium]|nr:hypothetical protein [Thermoanaerobaculia bacterium]
MVPSRPASPVVVAAILAVLPAFPLPGAVPTPTPRSGPLVRNVDVTVTNLDVVVTDRKGNRIRGLTREDFEVYEDGVLQPLTNFYAVDGGRVVFFGDEAIPGVDPPAAPAPAPVPAPSPIATPAPAPADPAVAPLPVPGTRIVIFIDNLSL